jgi:hypothetical protein
MQQRRAVLAVRFHSSERRMLTEQPLQRRGVASHDR